MVVYGYYKSPKRAYDCDITGNEKQTHKKVIGSNAGRSDNVHIYDTRMVSFVVSSVLKDFRLSLVEG